MIKSPQTFSPARFPTFVAALPGVAGATAILVGGLVLVGWARDLETLKRIIPGLVAMNPTTAILFLCSGVALLFAATQNQPDSIKIAARALAVIVMLIALTKFLDVFVKWLPDVDEILFSQKLNSNR